MQAQRMSKASAMANPGSVLRKVTQRLSKLARGVFVSATDETPPKRSACEADAARELLQGATMAARSRPRRYIIFGVNPPCRAIQGAHRSWIGLSLDLASRTR